MACGCGRSPTGKCIGWHALSEKEYQEKLKQYKRKTLMLNLFSFHYFVFFLPFYQKEDPKNLKIYHPIQQLI